MVCSSIGTSKSNDNVDIVNGSCVIGLEQLAKVAMASSGGISGRVNMARVLLSEGSPVYNLDVNTFQVYFTLWSWKTKIEKIFIIVLYLFLIIKLRM